jgi:uncharacterized protein
MTTRSKPRHRSGTGLGPEFRFFGTEGLELREDRSNPDVITVTGAPIVYNTPYSVRDQAGEFEETMEPTVVDSIIDSVDCRFLVNHAGLPLARTLSGTLKLLNTDESLRFAADLDLRSQLANDLASAIERGDVSQMSCGFIVDRDTWDASYSHRSIQAFRDLCDVSAVTYPASPTTSIEVQRAEWLEGFRAANPVNEVRINKIFSIVVPEIRAGKKLNKENAGHVLALLDHVKAANDALNAGKRAVKQATSHVTALANSVTPADSSAGGTDGSLNSPQPPAGLGNPDMTGSRTIYTGPSLVGATWTPENREE